MKGKTQKNSYFTKNEVETMHEMKSEGFSVDQISKKLGRSEKSIRSRLWRENAGRLKGNFEVGDFRAWTYREIRLLRSAKLSGDSIKDVCVKIGRNPDCAYQKIKKMGEDLHDESQWHKYSIVEE